MRKENLLETHPSEWTSRKDGCKFIPEATTTSDIFYFWSGKSQGKVRNLKSGICGNNVLVTFMVQKPFKYFLYFTGIQLLRDVYNKVVSYLQRHTVCSFQEEVRSQDTVFVIAGVTGRSVVSSVWLQLQIVLKRDCVAGDKGERTSTLFN